MSAPRPIRLGMVGGGQGAFIGSVHRIAARLDGHFELVAGALSADPARAAASAAELGLDPDRSFADYAEMARREAARSDGIEVVAIVTPNHLHYPVARAFLEAGIHVICDKPLTGSLADALALAGLVARTGRLLLITYNYSAYPLIREARAMVSAGALGRLRLVQVEYAQDWLTEKLEGSGQKQAEWRTDPARSGGGGAIGDIGSHAFHLASYVSGLRLQSLAADLQHFVADRQVDDNAQVLLRFEGGARGMLWASQVAPGHENDLRLRLYGDKGGLSWSQEDPNQLWHTPLGQPRRCITRGSAVVSPAAARVTRLPGGHPEGYLEAFATLYAEAAAVIRQAGGAHAAVSDEPRSWPDVQDGLAGMRFIDACLRSSRQNAGWVGMP